MDMKFTQRKLFNNFVNKHLPAMFYYIKIKQWGEFNMLKTLAKMAEKYAKSTNTACFIMSLFHQPKMPASLIKKDN